MGDPFEEGKDGYLSFLVQDKAVGLWLIRSSAVGFLGRDFFLAGLILEMREKNDLCVIVTLRQKIERLHYQRQDTGSVSRAKGALTQWIISGRREHGSQCGKE